MTNVLILMSDEHNHRVTSVTGHPVVNTPHLERLASAGTVFESAYCPSPLCAPCRSSFMAGLPVHQVQVYNNCCVERFDYPSYGAVLDRQGIHSTHIGKTDVYNVAAELGFTEILLAGDRTPPGDINFRRDPLAIRDDGERRAAEYGVRVDAFDDDLRVVDRAVDWLTGTAPGLDRPWSLTVNVKAPHFPHFVTQALWDAYAGGADLPAHGSAEPTANHPYAQDLRRHFQADVMTEEQVRGNRRGYLGRVEFVDTQLGRLLDALDATGQREDTVVIYTSDHGEMLGTFGLWWKSTLYEDSAHVPLVVAGPGFDAGGRVATPVSLLDVQATIFRATGTSRPGHWWGSALQDVAADDPSRVVFAEYHGHGTRSGSFMIRKGDWKLLWHAAAPHQLFNLRRDPHELRDRCEDEPDVAADLVCELRGLCSPERENERAHERERHQATLLARFAR